MRLTEKCVQDSLPIWEQCLNSAFLKQLEAGTLDPECLLGYIVDDSLYLREYAKVFAWGMLKSQTMEEIRVCYSLLSFVNEGEGSTRLSYLHGFGVEDAEIQLLPQRPENRAYTDCMLQAAEAGGLEECMMACLPCMLSYAWIFGKLLERSPGVRETVYWLLVRDYAGQGYADACQSWIAAADALCEGLPEQRQQKCLEIFRACSRHELNFWNMSASPRQDIQPRKAL